MYAIEMRNVYTAYPKTVDVALKGVNLHIPREKLVLITGPNGAGKTTLLELILGFLRPIKGTLRVLGYDMPKYSNIVRKKCSYVMQDFMKPYNTPYTAWEVVLMGLAPYKAPFEKLSRDERELLDYLLGFLEIRDLMDKPFGTLSGGQQQRVMLARALLRRPQMLLLDEPFSSIDADSRKDFALLLNDIRKKYRMTILVVSHDVSPLLDFADIIVRLRDGKIVDLQ